MFTMSNENGNFNTKYWNKSNSYKRKISKSLLNHRYSVMKHVHYSNKSFHRNSSPSPSYLESDSDYKTSTDTTQWSGSYISHGEADRRRITGLTAKTIIYLEPESLKFQERYLEQIAYQNLIKRNRQKHGICMQYPILFILDNQQLKYKSTMNDMQYMKAFEKIYKIPLLSDLWDTIGLLLLQCKILSFNRRYWDDIIKDIMINVPGLKKYISKILQKNNEIEQNGIINFASNSLPGKWFKCAYDMFNTYYGHIPIDTEIRYKLNGIWQIHTEIIREVNKHIETERHWHKNGIELHIRFWVNGLIKLDNCDENNENKMDMTYEDSSDESSDDETAVCYDIEINVAGNNVFRDNIDEYYNGIMDSYASIKELSILMKMQKHLCVTIIEQEEDELLEKFTTRVFQHKSSEPELFEAVMMLFDTSNAEKVIAYIWKRKLNYYTHRPFDYDLSDLRIKSKQCKHFEFIYNNKIIDVGKYVGMDVFILNEASIHSYWNIFNKSIRFISSHVNTIWRQYYKYDTLYEKKYEEFDDIKEFEQYVSNNTARLYINTDVYVEGETLKTKTQIINMLIEGLRSEQRCIRDFEPAKFRQFWYNVTECKFLNWGKAPRNGFKWINNQ
eukprot:246195_1